MSETNKMDKLILNGQNIDLSPDYQNIRNKPTINDVAIDGNKTLDDFGIATKQEVENVSEKVAKLPYGMYYGQYDDTESLPDVSHLTQRGYAYVATTEPNIFYIYTYNEEGDGWQDSGNKFDAGSLESNLSTKSQTKAPTTKAVAEGIESVNLLEAKTPATKLTKVQKYQASANINDRNADVAPVTNEVRTLGYKVLNPALSFAEQVTESSTIYEIKNEFDLDGASVTIPVNCILKFNGGRIVDSSVSKNGRILGLSKIVVTPFEIGCIKGRNANYAVTNSEQLQKLVDINEVTLVFDDDYTFGGANVDFKSLRIEGQLHFMSFTRFPIGINKDLYVTDLKYETVANTTTTVFQPKGNNTNNIVLDNFIIDNNEITNLRLIDTTLKRCEYYTPDGINQFNTTSLFGVGVFVLYQKNCYIAKTSHTGAWDKSHFKKCVVSVQDYSNPFSAEKAYSIGDKVTYNDGYYYFTANKTAGVWDDSKVQEVVKTEINTTKKVNLNISNSKLCNTKSDFGSGVVISFSNTLYDEFIFKNNIVHNFVDCLISAGADNDTMYSDIINESYVLGIQDRNTVITNNSVSNDLSFEPWKYITGDYSIFSTSESYERNDVVFNEDRMYIFIKAKGSGAWNSNTVISISEEASNFLTEASYEEDNVVRYDSKTYVFIDNKSSGEWDETKVAQINTISQHTYYTLLVLEAGRCLFSDNRISNVINQCDIYARTYDAYLSVHDLMHENNIIQNLYNIGSVVELIKSKSNSIDKYKNCYRYNSYIQEPLSTLFPNFDNFVCKTSLFREHYGDRLHIVNCSFNIADYYAANIRNEVKEYVFKNNFLYLGKAEGNEVEDKPDYRSTSAIIVIDPRQQKYVEVSNNIVNVGSASTATTISPFVGFPTYTIASTDTFDTVIIKDNVLHNCDLVYGVFAKNGFIENNNVTIDNVYYAQFPIATNLKFYGNTYNAKGYNSFVTGLGLQYQSFNEINDWQIDYIPNNENYFKVFCGVSSIKLVEITIEDEYGAKGTFVFVFDPSSSTKYFYSVNNSCQIVQYTSSSQIGNSIKPYGVKPFGIGSNNASIVITDRQCWFVFSSSAVTNNVKYKITGKVTKAISLTNLFPLPPSVNSISELPTDTRFKLTAGSIIKVNSTDYTWNGTKWTDGKGFTAAIHSGTSGQRPSLDSNDVNFGYFDTTLGKPIYWNGTAWVDGNGDIVDLQTSTTSINISAANNSTGTIDIYYPGTTPPTVQLLNSDDTACTWLTGSPSPFTGNTLTLTANANEGSTARAAKVVVTLDSETITINVTQLIPVS